MSTARRILFVALVLLALLDLAWFWHEPLARIVFTLPPALCALAVWLRRRTAGFWSGVFALLWFSHGVMVAWTRPPERLQAFAELALAVVIILAASVPGLRARFAKGNASQRNAAKE
ncbi:DUF2069 domain-containing protein [Solilutibacter silvestris]|uniref:DUF2069 domain-containing protein n=1 Tax=Solilutibacter silvestris TaxID=1645665 RepID=A0A2K1PXN1_9GAMM|nr:DUF2069 domain-containing protein [Lysobacter silvestris]PNS07545.1 hypothetical protein Lysil_1721 [Lysobacter silvestris]